MQQLIHQQWCAKVFYRYEDPTCQRPDPLTFLDEYRAYLPQQPTHQMPIPTGPALKETLSIGGSAGGLDGWRTAELQALPTWMWDFAAELWNAMTRAAQDHAEQHGALVPCESLWADFFQKGYCPLLDKGEGPEPLRQRALTILPLVSAVVVCHLRTVATVPSAMDPSLPIRPRQTQGLPQCGMGGTPGPRNSRGCPRTPLHRSLGCDKIL